MENFNAHKWFKKQYLEEAKVDEMVDPTNMDLDKAVYGDDAERDPATGNIKEDKMKYIEDLADAAEEAYDAGMDTDEILKFIEQHLGLKFGDY